MAGLGPAVHARTASAADRAIARGRQMAQAAILSLMVHVLLRSTILRRWRLLIIGISIQYVLSQCI